MVAHSILDAPMDRILNRTNKTHDRNETAEQEQLRATAF